MRDDSPKRRRSTRSCKRTSRRSTARWTTAPLRFACPGSCAKSSRGDLECGLLCRGFARVQCGDCSKKRLVAFGCGGRGFCPSCLGRKMAETTLNLSECVLPSEPLRQWVLTFPFAWRSRLGFDAPLFSAVTRLFVQTVLRFYTQRMKTVGRVARGQSGAGVGRRPESCWNSRAAAM